MARALRRGGRLQAGLGRGAVARALARQGPRFKAFLEEATAYVAIATVCDVVPLRDENRILARYGLKALASAKAPGIRPGSVLGFLGGAPYPQLQNRTGGLSTD